MDRNKEDALKSLKTGKDSTGALRFINKARRLDPSLPVDDLLQSVNSTSETMQRNPSGQDRKNYTEEQVTIVRDIKRKKDYYQILGLERTCSVNDICKLYRKLSLKVHPDKNNAPGAEEAFKLVSNVFRGLKDVGNRKSYDLNRSNEPRIVRATRSGHGATGNNDDIDFETFMRSYFGGGMARRTTTTHFRGFNFV